MTHIPDVVGGLILGFLIGTGIFAFYQIGLWGVLIFGLAAFAFGIYSTVKAEIWLLTKGLDFFEGRLSRISNALRRREEAGQASKVQIRQ